MIKTVSGGGESAQDALEALAFGLKDHEVDEAAGKCIVVHLKRTKVQAHGRPPMSSHTHQG